MRLHLPLRQILVLLLLALLIGNFNISRAAPQPAGLFQATETPSEEEILLTPPLARTPLPTFPAEESSGTGWIAASAMMVFCMILMLAGGILIAAVAIRLRTRR